MVDTNDLPLRLALAPDRQHDIVAAHELLEGVPSGGMVRAEKAYDSDAIRTLVASCGGCANMLGLHC